ncbi:MAG: hypothetical protein ABFD82_19935 [Syntrophaceae bacterium]
MKTIGFIDIHPQSPVCKPEYSSPSQDIDGEDKSVIYLFEDDNYGYNYLETLAYNSPDELVDVNDYYISIPASLLDYRIVTFPFSDKEKIKKSLPIELDNLVLGGSEEIIFDTIIPDSSDDSVDVLVAYIGKNILHRILKEFAGRNIDPRCITSIDLQSVTNDINADSSEGFRKTVAERLFVQQKWDEADRIAQAKQEIEKPTINLRTGQFVYTKDAEKMGRTLKITVLLGFLLAFVIHANILFQTIMTKKEAAAIAKEMRISYNSLFPDEKKTIDELYQLKSHIKEIGEKNDTLTGVDSLKLLMDLSNKEENNVVYTEVQIEKGLIKLKGESRSTDELSKVKTKLSEILSDVSVSDVKPVAQGKTLFTIVAKEK